MEKPIHGNDRYQRFIEKPFISEYTIRDELFMRDWKEFPKFHLMDRYIDHKEAADDKKKLLKALAWLHDLKLIFQSLGPIAFSIRSETNNQETGAYKGIPACVAEEEDPKKDPKKKVTDERKRNVNFSKLTALVENQATYTAHREEIENELAKHQNYKFQQFLIYNYGEKLNLVPKSESGRFPYLRKRGLSMKEIELIIFALRFHSHVEPVIPDVFSYIEKEWWSDILNFTKQYMKDHDDVMKALDDYLKTYVTHTFVTAFQEFYESDLTVCLKDLCIDWSKLIIDNYMETNENGGDDDTDAKRQRLE